jgi:hypothetical protein
MSSSSIVLVALLSSFQLLQSPNPLTLSRGEERDLGNVAALSGNVHPMS